MSKRNSAEIKPSIVPTMREILPHHASLQVPTMVILGSTDRRAPLAIGLYLTLIHLISIPVTNTSIDPARSTGVALFAGGPYLMQLWLFWIGPIVGALLGALAYRLLAGTTSPGRPAAPVSMA
jgi:aquaporin Z